MWLNFKYLIPKRLEIEEAAYLLEFSGYFAFLYLQTSAKLVELGFLKLKRKYLVFYAAFNVALYLQVSQFAEAIGWELKTAAGCLNTSTNFPIK